MYVNLYQLFTESFITNLYLVNRTDLIIGDNSWFELFTQHQHSFPPLWRVLNNNHRNILTLDTAITSIAQHNTAIPGSKTPEGIATKLEVRWLHPGPYLNFKIWQRSGCVGRLGACTKYQFVTFFCLFLLFSFLHLTYRSPRLTGFTTYTSNDVFSCKEVLFGGLDDEFSHLPRFLPLKQTHKPVRQMHISPSTP